MPYAIQVKAEKLSGSENSALTLLSHKQDFERLKEEYLTNIAWSQFLSYLKDGPSESKIITDHEFEKEKLRESKTKLRKEKDVLREAEENVEKLIIEDSEKIKKIEELTRMIEERENNINEMASILASLEEEENKWAENAEAEAELEAEEKELARQISRMKQNIKKKENKNKKQSKLRKTKEKEVEDIQQKISQQLELNKPDENRCWKVSLEQKLACFSFINNVDFDESKKSMSLEIGGHSPEYVPVQLTVYFRKNEEQNIYVIDRAETSMEGLLHIDEILETVKGSVNVGALVSEVKGAYLQQLDLSKEIEELRKKYAMDWLANEGLIRVMLGGSGQVICTLSIKRSYPSPGSVQLVKVEGIQLGEISDAQLQVITDNCETGQSSITQWFEYLKKFVQEKM